MLADAAGIVMGRMTEASLDIVRSLAEHWTGLLARVLESMGGQRPAMSWTLGTPSAPDAGVFWWEQRLSLAETPLVYVGAPAKVWREFGERTLRAAGIETEEEADARSTYLEILGQSLSGLVQELTGRLGFEVTCGQGESRESVPETAVWITVTAKYPDNEFTGILLGFHPQLVARLEHPDAAEEGEEAEAAPAATGPISPRSKTFDLLLDVELPVSVSFGRADLPLKDVLKLTTGSIVELNRGVHEPVEVIVNNCVVARGEVVVMEGNYGVRIHQIISPQERLRTLK
jgi:flagellar motor switch protein FliN/FliY